MPKSEGMVVDFLSEREIKRDLLETFLYEGERELIKIDTKEFSAVCPFSGLPDIARVIIQYIPNQKCIELKSLKYYFLSFRNVGIYQEAVTSRIYKDLNATISPESISVVTIYNTRGGMDVVSRCGNDPIL